MDANAAARCPHAEKGCRWEGSVAFAASHLQICPFEALRYYIEEKELEIQELKLQLQRVQVTLAGFTQESQVERRALRLHTDAVVSLAVHGGFLFSGSMDGMLKVVRMDTLQLVREVSLGPVFQLKIASGRLYSGHTNTIRVWDLSTYALAAELPGHNGFVKAIFAQGNRLFSGAKGEIKIWDAATLRCLHTVPGAHNGDIRDFAAVTDSTGMTLFLFSCGDDGYIRAWNRSFVCERLVRAHTAPIRAMVCATVPSVGDFLVTGSDDSYIKIWDISLSDPNTSMVARIPCLVGVTSLVFVPPCQLISGHADGSLRVWNIEKPRAVRCERLLAGHSEHVRALAIASNCFVSGSYDGSVICWYPAGGAPPQPVAPQAQ